MARVDGPCQRVLCHSFRDDWVKLDHTKLRPAQVLVCMEKGRLLFRSARMLENEEFTREKKQRTATRAFQNRLSSS